MDDRTQELLDKVAESTFFPSPVRAQIIRSLGQERVLTFAVVPTFRVGDGSGIDMQMRVVVATRTRLLQWVWFEAAVPSDESLRDPLEAMLDDAPPAQQMRLTCLTRVVPLVQVVDVQTTIQYSAPDAAGVVELAAVKVLMLSATLNHLIAEQRECDDPEGCDGSHGFEVVANQDGLVVAMNRDQADAESLEHLVQFAGELENAMGQ